MNRRTWVSLTGVTGIMALAGCNTKLLNRLGGEPGDGGNKGYEDTPLPSDEDDESDVITEFEGEGSDMTDSFEFEGDANLKIRAAGNIEAHLLDQKGEQGDELIVETAGNSSSITSNYLRRGGEWAVDLTTNDHIEWLISVRRIEWQEVA